MLAHVNIGVRYVLPAYPFAILLIAGLWRDDFVTTRSPKRLSTARLALLSLFVGESLWHCPRFMSFINFAAGGTERGWRIVNDSNFDWGQGLLDLKRWQDEHGNPKMALMYFGRVEPSIYGVAGPPITSARGDEPFLAVSTYFLAGMSHRLTTPEGPTDFLSLPYAGELRREPPFDRAGPTVYIYTTGAAAAAADEARRRLRRSM
jgi:hypothetical protein